MAFLFVRDVNAKSPVDKRLSEEPPLFYESVLKLLECPVCYDLLEPPIYQCVSGHPLCPRCRPNCAHCPHCRQEFMPDTSRNYRLEAFTELILYACKNVGCLSKFKLTEREPHQQECAHRTITCASAVDQPGKTGKWTACTWKGSVGDLYAHLQSESGHKLIEDFRQQSRDCTVRFSLNHISDFLYACFDSNVFRVRLRKSADDDGGLLFFCVELVGAKSTAARYSFNVRFSSAVNAMEGNSDIERKSPSDGPVVKLQSTQPVHSDHELGEDDKQCVPLLNEQWLVRKQLICEKKGLTATFRIFRTAL